MNPKLPLLCAVMACCVLTASSQTSTVPTAKLSDLLIEKELNPGTARDAQHVARQHGLPVSLYLHEGVIIEVLAIENGRPVYGVITNLAHPFEGGRTAFYEEIATQFNLSTAVDLQRGPIILQSTMQPRSSSTTEFFLVPDWTNDKVMAFDPVTGNPVDTSFVPPSPGILASPKEALGTPRGTITVSDQITDAVQEFDASGTYQRLFAPAGGVNTAILDNIRGHAYRANGNLIVCVASGANANSIAQFDSGGNYIGNFIGNSVGGLNSPFGILFRTNDILITQSSAPTGVKQYDLNGAYIGQWTTITSFPQQIIELPGGRVAVANFSGTGNTGIRLYQSDGTFIRLLSGVTGNRGVAQIANGNFLTTNGAGIHEIDSTTGALVRTILGGTSLQYITRFGTVTSSPDMPGLVPERFTLEQNHPNPFNPATTISFQVPAMSFVDLRVYDVLGREVATLVHEEKPPGRYAVTWDAGAAASGVYLYRLQAGRFVETRKLVLVR